MEMDRTFKKLKKPWTKCYFDGSCPENPGESSCGVHVLDENDQEITRFGRYLGKGTNNTAEYGGAIEAVKWLLDNGYKDKKCKLYGDSRLVVLQYVGRYKTKNNKLKVLKAELKALTSQFIIPLEIRWLKRERNTIADEQAALALVKAGFESDWLADLD